MVVIDKPVLTMACFHSLALFTVIIVYTKAIWHLGALESIISGYNVYTCEYQVNVVDHIVGPR